MDHDQRGKERRERARTPRAVSSEKRQFGPTPAGRIAGIRQEDLKDQAQDIHEEARMVLPGVQALFGFQLVGAFNQRFIQLSSLDQIIYIWALLLVTLAIGLLMAPAAYHRLREPKQLSIGFVATSSRLVAAGMVPLMIAIAVDVYIVARLCLGNAATLISITCGVAALSILLVLWFVFPLRRVAGPGRT
jgi:hypothetical protein